MNPPTLPANSLRLLVIMQTLHQERAGRLELDALHAGMLRLVTDGFTHVTLAAPVLRDGHGETIPYPAVFRFAPLFRRRARTGHVTLAFKHVASMWVMLQAMRYADVVHVRLPSYSSLGGGLLALALKKPIIASFHGSSDGGHRVDGTGRRHVLSRAAAAATRAGYRWISRDAILNLVSGPRLVDELDGRAAIVGHHQFSEADMAERTDTCAGPRINLLYVGRLSHEKGIPVLLDALKSLCTTDPRVRLTLVGAPWRLDLEAELRGRQLESVVTQVGPVAFGHALFQHYRTADLLVFPSLHEGVPKVPMEALAQALPVITTRMATGGYLRHREHGLVIPENDPAALASAVREMISDGDLRRGCIVRGLALAREHSRERMQARIGTLVANALAERLNGRQEHVPSEGR